LHRLGDIEDCVPLWDGQKVERDVAACDPIMHLTESCGMTKEVLSRLERSPAEQRMPGFEGEFTTDYTMAFQFCGDTAGRITRVEKDSGVGLRCHGYVHLPGGPSQKGQTSDDNDGDQSAQVLSLNGSAERATVTPVHVISMHLREVRIAAYLEPWRRPCGR